MSVFVVALGVSFFACHEIDAVRAAEWRILPGLSRLGDADGFRAFAILHLPLYCALIWALVDGGSQADGAVPVGLDIFYVLHAGAHIVLRNVTRNAFRGQTSWVFILGAAFCGIAHLILTSTP